MPKQKDQLISKREHVCAACGEERSDKRRMLTIFPAMYVMGHGNRIKRAPKVTVCEECLVLGIVTPGSKSERSISRCLLDRLSDCYNKLCEAKK